MIHPFREGNGRTQKIFIEKVAKKLGYALELNKLDPKKLLEATIESVDGTGKPLGKIFESALVTKQSNLKTGKNQSEKINTRPMNTRTKMEYELER